MASWARGDLVELDGLLAVVVGVEGDENVPEDHVALWFGEPSCVRRSQGGPGGQTPLVYTVPAEYCTRAKPPSWNH
jgi:hypothetical protein